MQSVIEIVMSVVAALGLAVLAQFGLGADDRAPSETPRAERVVARSPQTAPPAVRTVPRSHDDDCELTRVAAAAVA